MTSSVPQRFETLDAFRGVCALLVAVYHMRVQFSLYDADFLRNSFLFVDFFFVLSGFVLQHAYGQRLKSGIDLRKFVIRRFGRLWPLHIATMLSVIFLELAELGVTGATGMESNPLGADVWEIGSSIGQSVFLIHAFNESLSAAFNFPSWSISVEFYAYLVFAATVMLMPNRKWIAFAALSFVGFIVVANFSERFMQVNYGWSFYRCLAGFFVGALLRMGYTRLTAFKPKSEALLSIIQMMMIASVFIFVSNFARGPSGMLAPFIFAISILIMSWPGGWLSQLLSTKGMAKLGLWSYSIYMVHIPIYMAISKTAVFINQQSECDFVRLGHGTKGAFRIDFGSVWINNFFALALIALVVIVASYTYRFIEAPGRDAFNAISRRLAST